MFAALGFEFDPGVTIARRGEPEVAAEIEVLILVFDWLVVRRSGSKGRLDLELTIDEEGGGATATEKQAMLAGGEIDVREGAEEERVSTFGAYAGIDVFLRHAGEAEGWRDVAVGDDGGLFGPDVGGRFPVFAEFDAHLAVRDGGPVDLGGLADDFGYLGGLGAAGAVVAGVGARADLGDLSFGDGRKGGGKAPGDFYRRDKGTMQAEVVDGAAEAAIGEAAHRRANPDRGVVDDGFVGRGTVHVPRTFDLLAVDPAADALGFPEGVADRDMVPASVVGEASGSRPAVPLDPRAGRRSEEEVKAGAIVEYAQTQGPILVAGIGGLRVIAPFTDHVGVLAFAKPVRLHPGFEGDRIAVLEVEEAVHARVLDREVCALAIEGRRFIRLLETRVVRTSRAGLFELHVAGRGEFRARRAVERPGRGGLGGGEGRETEEKGGETTHLQMGQRRGGGGSA